MRVVLINGNIVEDVFEIEDPGASVVRDGRQYFWLAQSLDGNHGVIGSWK